VEITSNNVLYSFLLPFGISISRLKEMIEAFNESNVIGVDIVEYNPLLDKNGKDSYIVLDIVKAVLNIMS